METHQDEHIVCATCGTTFVFTAAEAALYAERNLVAPPKRCRACRRAQKEQFGRHKSARRNHGAPGNNRPPRTGGFNDSYPRTQRYTGDVDEYRSPMQDRYGTPWLDSSRSNNQQSRYNSDSYRAPSFPNDRQGRRSDARSANPRTPFSITCKACGAKGEVPFQPMEGRDVFCKSCYRARKPG